MKKKYLIEFIIFFSYFMFAAAWTGGTAFLGPIMEAMGITSLASASFISTSVTFAKIVGTAIAAWVLVKFGIKKAFALSSLMICVSIITPYSPNYPVLLMSRFVMGLGGALMVVYLNPIVVDIFDAKERPVVNGLNAVAFNAGTALVFFFVNDFVAIFGGWKQTLVAFSIASVIFFVLWLVFGNYNKGNTAAAKEQKADDAAYTFMDGLKDPFNWKFSLSYSGILAFYIVLFTFYPKAGISQAKYVILMGIVGALAGIVYSKRFSKRVPIIRFSGLIITLSVIGLNFSSANPALAAVSASILGFFIFFPMTALVTLAQEMPNVTPRKISVTFSLFYSISYIVATIVPTIFGALVDANNGSFTVSFIFITVVSTTFFIGSFFLPEPSKLTEKSPSAPKAV